MCERCATLENALREMADAEWMVFFSSKWKAERQAVLARARVALSSAPTAPREDRRATDEELAAYDDLFDDEPRDAQKDTALADIARTLRHAEATADSYGGEDSWLSAYRRDVAVLLSLAASAGSHAAQDTTL